MPRRIALASGILLLISLFATNKSFAVAAFAGGSVTPITQNVCSGGVGTLSFTGTSFTVGLGTDWTANYQWQSSPDNITWTNIAGANGSFSAASPTVTYVTPVLTFVGTGCGAPTYYRIVISAISNTIVGDPYITGPTISTPATIFVCANPAPITGPTSVCQGSTITVADATSGGTWSSSTPTVGTISSAGGVITGLSGGTTIVTYALGSGCSDTALITVNSRPSVITGDSTVCIGATITVFDSTLSGAWSMVSATPHLSISTIGVVGGLEAAAVTGSGVSGGTNLITYTSLQGCVRTKQITVNPQPAFSVTMTVCQGGTITLSALPTGGTWLSGTPSVATITSAGVVSGVLGGTSIITYTDIVGCTNTDTVTVNAAPLPITGTFSVCVGSTTTLASGTSGGVWSSGSIGVATVSPTGVVSGLSAGTTIITYLDPGTSCFVTQIVTVLPVPAAIVGTMHLCAGGLTTTLTNGTMGGSWASSNGTIAAIGSANGVVTSGIPGTALISYILPTGCYVTAIFTSDSLPTAINGSLTTCANSTTTLSGVPTGGSFSSSSPLLTSVNPATGVIVAGATTGTATVTYTLPTGCSLTAVINITAAAPPIAGTLNTCVGNCTSLSHTTPGGTWASSNTAVGTINASGVACGVLGGTTNITYTEPGGCLAISTLTVTAMPAAITGPSSVCIGSTITLSSSTPGGTWSSSSPNGTVGTTNGVVGGVTAGNIIITYSLTGVSNCFVTHAVSVNAAPTAIVATPLDSICVGGTTTLSSTPAGGTWFATTPGIASVNPSTGVVTGVSGAGGGVGTIIYTAPTGCTVTTTVSVSSNPIILGGLTVCPGTTTSLAGIPPGGTWTSSNGTGTIIVFGSGIVTGVTAGPVGTSGTGFVTYTLPGGCFTVATVTINPLPAPIVATSVNICVGGTSTLSNTTTGGTWTGSTAVASVSPTGVVTGLTGGTVNITYQVSATGCYSFITLTVDPLLPAITGASHVCLGLTTTLSIGVSGGTWTSSAPSIASIDPSTGVVTGASAGTATIDYSTASGCSATLLFTVDSLPTVTPASATVCIGATTTLVGSPSGGAWTTAGGNVSVGSGSGVVTGVAAGTAAVTYTVASTGCTATATITVNALPLPNAPHGAVCQFDSITLTNPTPGGGTWSTTSTIITVGGTTGVVVGGSPGTAVVTFTSAVTGCTINDTITVNVGPTNINGVHEICVGDSTLLSSSPSGGFWTAPPGIFATVNPLTGMVHGIAGGPATISYTLSSSGCSATFDMTINPLPTPILVAPVCVGSTTIAISSPTGGTWSLTPPSVAFIDPATGSLTGLSPGTVMLTYSLPTGCSITAIDTVYALPTPIIGDTQICAGFTGTLTSTPAGGTWSSSFPPILSIGSTTGIISAVFPGGGTVTVTYVDPHSCSVSKVITVNPIPPDIEGDSVLCAGDTATLFDITTGGTWMSSNTTVATIGSASGLLTGVWGGTSPATATITYTLPTGCYITKVITVNPNPQPVTGTMQMCSGTCVTLNVATAGGSWTSGNPPVATALGIGIGQALVCGTNLTLLPDTATIRYTVTYYGLGDSSKCYSAAVVTVNPNPRPITGTLTICQGTTTTLSNAIPGGTWSIVPPGTGTATIGISTGILTGSTPGTVTVRYTVWPTACTRDTVVTIVAPPAPIAGPSVLCKDDSITVSNPTPGGSFSTTFTTIISITAGGKIIGLSAGTAIITYTVPPTNCFVTKVITVNPLPGAIGGLSSVCLGDSTILYNVSSPGGVWTVSPGGIITLTPIGTTGDTVKVKSVAAGSVTITYTLPTGCLTTVGFTVNPLPTPILGVASICQGDSTTLYNLTSILGSPGLWTWHNVTGIITLGVIPNPGATADSTRVYGIAAGTAVVTYQEPTHQCIVTRTVTVNPLPTAITGPTKVCHGFSDTLHISTPGGHWTTSDVSIATVDTNGVVTGVNPGVVMITYTLNATGCYITRFFTVNPIPNVTVNHPEIICRKSSVKLIASGANSYVWNPTSGLSSATGDSVIASPTLTTSYTVTGTSAAGCSDTAVVTVVVDTLLNNIGIAGRDSICAGMCDTLVALGFHGSLFSWVPPAGLSCIVCDTTVACPTGSTTYMAVAIDSFGCRDTASFHITVMPLPRLTYSPQPPYVCFGDSSQVTVTDLNATSTYQSKFVWFPNVFLSCDTCATPWISDTFSLVYRVIGISPFGCYDSIKIPVSVLKNSLNTINKDTVVCPGVCVQLRSSSVNPDGSTSTFQWSPGNTLNATGIANPIACPQSTTTYTLVISPNVCFHDTETVTIGVSPIPEIEITPKSTNVVAGTPIQLSAVITNDVLITSYAWSPSSSLSCEVCYNPIATPTFTTTYVFTATSNYGCTASDSVRFTTTCDNSQIYIANTFTPNGDGINDRFFISGKGISRITTFIVVNRWGEVVFENHNLAPNDPGAGWDGTYKGLVVPPDVFMYIVEGICELGSPLKFTGDVSIVR